MPPNVPSLISDMLQLGAPKQVVGSGQTPFSIGLAPLHNTRKGLAFESTRRANLGAHSGQACCSFHTQPKWNLLAS